MTAFPRDRKPIGFKVKRQEGQWLVTYEVIGYNENLGCNTWEQVRKRFNPEPSLANAIRAIDEDRAYQRTIMLHRKISAV